MNNSTTIANGKTLSVISGGVEFVLSTNEGDLEVRCVSSSPYFSDALDVHQRAANCVTLKPQMKHDPIGIKIPDLPWKKLDDRHYGAVCTFTGINYEYRYSLPFRAAEQPHETTVRVKTRSNSYLLNDWQNFDGGPEEFTVWAQADYAKRIIGLLASA
jgi:hypothetical protein